MAFPTSLATLVHEPPHIRSPPKNIYSINRIDIIFDAQTSFLFKPHPLFGFVDVYRSDKDVDKFRNSPDMKNWNQQLNFAVWCATSGCGIGLDLLTPKENREMKFIASLLQFHVYYTTRRVLHWVRHFPMKWILILKITAIVRFLTLTSSLNSIL